MSKQCVPVKVVTLFVQPQTRKLPLLAEQMILKFITDQLDDARHKCCRQRYSILNRDLLFRVLYRTYARAP